MSRNPHDGWRMRSFQVSQLAEDLKAGVDFPPSQILEALGTETFHGEGSHHAAVEEGAFRDFAIELSLRRDIAQEAACECISRSGGIHNFFNGQRRGAKRMRTNA